MNMPDEVLTSLMRQLAAETGLHVTIVHPGALYGEVARSAFSGLPADALERMAFGQPNISMESDDTLCLIDREITAAIIRRTAEMGKTGAWAAFFDPDGTAHAVLPLSGSNVIYGPFGRAA